ncbi:hypothetical protein C1H46_026749 [Malus baccata]|uniref:Uncharacterized protein n=1 Tax=Malus baccata TaxID=106549 RepID=A0A540LMQ1_MALBA|nr:hypothetical protein C1H46_026749 [Malus baccata]
MTISAFVVPDHVRHCGIVPNLGQSLFQTADILCSSRRLNPASSVTKPGQSRPQLLLAEQSQSATQPQQQQLVVHNSIGSLIFNSNMSKEDKEMSRYSLDKSQNMVLMGGLRKQVVASSRDGSGSQAQGFWGAVGDIAR